MQLPFPAETLIRQPAEIINLQDGQLQLHAHFLSHDEADVLLETLLTETPWRQDALNFGGRRVLIPRLQAWYGDKHSDYGYSGLALKPLPWSSALLSVKHRIEQTSGQSFNSVLLNYYRNGQDSVSWHSDDEPELGPNPVIASLSLGATRRFELKHRHKNIQKAVCDLDHGSLLVMGEGIQRHWRHQIPKQPAIPSPRVNLTFRYIHPPSPV